MEFPINIMRKKKHKFRPLLASDTGGIKNSS